VTNAALFLPQTQPGAEKVKVRVSTESGNFVFYIAVNSVFVWTRKARQFLNSCSNFMADGSLRPDGYFLYILFRPVRNSTA